MKFTPPDLGSMIAQANALCRDSWIDFTKPAPKPDWWLSVWDDGKKIGVLGPGMFGAVSGPSKSNKTYVASMMLASALSGGDEILNFQLDIPPGTPVVWLDTEQGDYHAEMVPRRALRLAGKQDKVPQWFMAAAWRKKMSPYDRLAALTSLMSNLPNSVFFLDGITDLMENTNSIDESAWLISHLMAMCSEHNVMLLVVIHTNEKGLDKEMGRGAIGSAIERKAELRVDVRLKPKAEPKKGRKGKKDEEEPEPASKKDVFVVSFPAVRERRPSAFIFSRPDDDRLMPEYNERTTQTEILF